MQTLLSRQEVESELQGLEGWTVVEDAESISRSFEFEGFLAAIRFINALAELAEAENHHPDLGLHFRNLEVILWSHDAGGVTPRDLRLAAKIDALFASKKTW